MQLTKLLIFALFLPARFYQAETVDSTSRSEKATSVLVEGVVNIVTSCYRDQINAVVLVGNLPATLSRTLSVQHLIPVVLIDVSHTFDVSALSFAHDKFRYKLQVVIVEVSSYKHLLATIEFLSTTIWWNHMASFFIVDQTPGCDNIGSFLFVSWHYDLLNVKVMCYHHTYGDFILNYNPFTSQAPAPWKLFDISEGVNKHPFALFSQRYQGNEAICVELDFIKTKDLGGYEIHVEGRTRGFKDRHNLDQKKWADLIRAIGERERLLHLVYRALNATPKFSGLNREHLPNDVEMNIRYGFVQIHKYGISMHTYPFQQAGVVLISNYRGHKSQLEKILCVVDFDSRIGLGIVYLITMIFLKFFVHQTLGPTLLNLVRMTCNTGFTNLSDNTASRVYLTALLFFVVTMQGIYQGNLASLLTNAIPVRNVNSFEDLVNFGYKLYGSERLYDLLEDADLRNRFIPVIDVNECVTYAMHDSSAACMSVAGGFLFDLARLNDLHLSREFVKQVPVGFVIRPYWYLEERMNTILGTLMEADIFESWIEKCNPTKLDEFQFDKEVRANTDFKIIELSELGFAFLILGIGLLFATVTFIFEVAIYRYQQRNNNTIIVL